MVSKLQQGVFQRGRESVDELNPVELAHGVTDEGHRGDIIENFVDACLQARQTAVQIGRNVGEVVGKQGPVLKRLELEQSDPTPATATSRSG